MIVYVLTRYPVLSETFILYEMLELRRQGVDVTALALRREEGPAQPEAPLVPVTYVPPLHDPAVLRSLLRALVRSPREAVRTLALLEGARRPSAVLRSFWAAERLRPLGVRRVHAQYAHHSADVAQALSGLLGVPFSLAVHANDAFKLSARELRHRARGADLVVACNECVRRRLQECGIEAVLVHHGVDVSFFQPAPHSPPEPLRLVSVGRLREKKGFPVLIEACRLLAERGVQFELSIVGDGPQRRELEELLERRGLWGRVRLRGSLDRYGVRQELQRSHLFVLASVVDERGGRDGVPNALLEAMACGLPVVASRVGGLPEAVSDGVEGLLVPPGDPQALAQAVQRLADAGVRRQMGEAARRRALGEFSLQDNVRELGRLLCR